MKPVSTESPLLQEALISGHTHPGQTPSKMPEGQTPVNSQHCQKALCITVGLLSSL